MDALQAEMPKLANIVISLTSYYCQRLPQPRASSSSPTSGKYLRLMLYSASIYPKRAEHTNSCSTCLKTDKELGRPMRRCSNRNSVFYCSKEFRKAPRCTPAVEECQLRMVPKKQELEDELTFVSRQFGRRSTLCASASTHADRDGGGGIEDELRVD
ncbi:hypothetical protein C8R45DRAFT_924238 [Mycena sanguinolenta]|nr:hypothetical protein C8R45DRAFT_924238 [Mycena sanguinolenta]